MKKLLAVSLAFFFATAAVPGFGATAAEQPLVRERIGYFNALVPADHPRLMLKRSELPEWRRFVQSLRNRKEYAPLYKNILQKVTPGELPGEPASPHGKGYEERQIWEQGYKIAFSAGSKAQQCAFSYLLTGEEPYGREAGRLLVNLAGWDVNGGINIKRNDEAFIQSLRPMLFAYDWAHDALTPDERQLVLQAFDVRLKILYQLIANKFSLTKPTPPDNSLSHPMRFISTLGLAGLVLYQELPEAPTYLAWAYEYYLRQFPVWGGSDGGWSEGLNYWSSGINQHFQFLDALKTLGNTELFAKPFFRNNGYFGLYNLQPYSASSFGDLCNSIGPSPNTALIFEKYALLYQDPFYQKYFETIFQRYPSGLAYYQFSFFDTVFHLYRKSQTPVRARDLAELPRSRYFADIGWVAIHSKLGSKADDIMLGFKSSPYGSASHSFSDQNSFVLNAFGEPLAISSGYREWYGSPHHDSWTRTTQAKNAVLFGGQGQPIKDPTASGTITHFYTGQNYDFTSGDAVKAYSRLGVSQALRHILFINRRYFMLLDELQSEKPVSHQWLLHAKNPFDFNVKTGRVTLHRNQAGLAVQFLVPAARALRFSQTDQFAAAVHPAYQSKMTNEWHFTADAQQASAGQDFLTLLEPFRLPAPTTAKAQLLKTDAGYAVDLTESDSQTTVWMAKEKQRWVRSAAGSLRGLAGVVSTSHNRPSRFFLYDGMLLRTKRLNIETSLPATLEGSFEPAGLVLSVTAKLPYELRITVPFVPTAIRGLHAENWHYDRESHQLILQISDSATLLVM